MKETAEFRFGGIMPIPRGEWAEDQTYRTGDIVRHKAKSYWVRVNDLTGIAPNGETDENYQLLVRDYDDERYLDRENLLWVQFMGLDPREENLVNRLKSVLRNEGEMFSDPEELRSVAEKGCYFSGTGISGASNSTGVVRAGDQISFCALSIEGIGAAVAESPEKRIAWAIETDSAGTCRVAKDVDYLLRSSKQTTTGWCYFSQEYRGDFGAGFEEEGYIDTFENPLPISETVVLLPNEGEEQLFRDAEIIVKEAGFRTEVNDSGTYSVFTATIITHNKNMQGQGIGFRVVAL